MSPMREISDRQHVSASRIWSEMRVQGTVTETYNHDDTDVRWFAVPAALAASGLGIIAFRTL